MMQRHVVTGLRAGQDYEVRVRGIAGLVRGPWSGVGAGMGALDTTPPGLPTGLAATGVIRGIALSWTNPADPDLKWVEIQEAGASNGPWTGIGQTGGTAFLRPGLAPGASLWFRLRAVDASGNASGWTGPVQGSASLLDAADIAQGIIDTAAFAQGIEPVGLVASGPVPTTRSTEIILHAPTNQLYRWDSAAGAYVRVVRAADLDGQLGPGQLGALSVTAGTIAAGAVSTPELAAGAGRAVNRASETLITQAAQLGTAVVGAAQIADAAIQSAKIGDLQVNTIKVAGNAITTTVAASWTGNVSWQVGQPWTQIAGVTLGDGFGGTYTLLASVDFSGRNFFNDEFYGYVDITSVGIRLRRGATVIKEVYTFTEHTTVFYIDDIGGMQSYWLDTRVPGGGSTVYAGTLAATQARR